MNSYQMVLHRPVETAPVIGNYDYQPLRTDLVQSELLNGLALSNGRRFRLHEYPEVILESYR